MLIHLIDATQDDVVDAYKTIRKELAAYDGDLASKPEILALNKVDALDDETRAAKAKALKKAAKVTPRLISGVSGEGVTALLREAARMVYEKRGEERAADAPEPEAWRP